MTIMPANINRRVMAKPPSHDPLHTLLIANADRYPD